MKTQAGEYDGTTVWKNLSYLQMKLGKIMPKARQLEPKYIIEMGHWNCSNQGLTWTTPSHKYKKQFCSEQNDFWHSEVQNLIGIVLFSLILRVLLTLISSLIFQDVRGRNSEGKERERLKVIVLIKVN